METLWFCDFEKYSVINIIAWLKLITYQEIKTIIIIKAWMSYAHESYVNNAFVH